MPLAALIVPILLAGADAPINVVGHAWAPFISPMGEPFRARTRTDDTLSNWFRQADRNHDGMLAPDEMQADADRFFARLDSDHNGEIEPDELAHYEWEIAPDIQVMAKTKRSPADPVPVASQTESEGDVGNRRVRQHRRDEEIAQLAIGGGLQGAARYGLLNMPEPVAAADMDFDRGISRAEFRQAAAVRFSLLDTKRVGGLTLDELQILRTAALNGKKAKRDLNALDTRVGNPLPTDD